jgi:hypothetical protein
MKRIYLFEIDEYTIAFVARSSGQAKMMWLHSDWGQGDCFLELLCTISKVSAKGLPLGELDSMEGLKRKVWNRLIETECPMCKHEADLFYRNEKIGCRECLGMTEDEEYE